MNNHFLAHLPSRPLPSRLLASGLCLGLLGILGVSIGSDLLVAPAVAEAQIPSTKEVSTQNLIGKWEGEFAPNKKITWVFTPEGKLFMLLPVPNEAPQLALEWHYHTDDSNKPMGLNIELKKGQTVMTIFEFVDDKQMRIQIEGTNPGDTRPNSFQNPTVFKKVSTDATLPPNTQVDEFDGKS